MTYNSAKILDLDNLTPDDHLFLGDLQGNILKGHGRNHVGMIFFTIASSKVADAKKTIKAFPVTSAQKQLDDTAMFKASDGKHGGEMFGAFFLSHFGYVKLGVAVASIPPDTSFGAGAKSRVAALNDPPTNQWETGFQANVDGMFLLAHSDLGVLTDAMMDLRKQVQDWTSPALTMTIQEGLAYRNADNEGMEHFGYLDGRSQPLMIKQDILVEQYDKGGISVFDPSTTMDVVVVPDPLGKGTNGTSFGSYFVFRKLEQNVRAFLDREDDLARTLSLFGSDFDRGGAMVVGRFEDGTPVVMSDDDGQTDPVSNNFVYPPSDGTKCPFQGHIRKSNPRNPAFPKKVMARRGITYGQRVQNPDMTFADRPEKQVGLLFMAYQNSILNEFEFIQINWVNNPNFPPLASPVGIDPIIGRLAAGVTPPDSTWFPEYGQSSPSVPFSYNASVSVPKTPEYFVTMKGGEYFFAPSLSGILSL